jgi:predicted metalloendopeptidase
MRTRVGIVVLFAALATLTVAAQAPDPAGVTKSWMDTNIRPQDDLFRHANGRWLRETQLRPDQSSFSSFGIVTELVQDQLREIAEHPRTPVEQKLAAFYQSFMDVPRIEAAGLGALSDDLRAIDAVTSRDDLGAVMGRMNRLDVNMPVTLGAQVDPGDPTKYAAVLRQSGLAMPNRDYYLREEPAFVGYRKALQTYVTRLLELSGQSNAPATALRVVALESALAVQQWSAADVRDRLRAYNPMDVSALSTSYPGFAWNRWADAAGLSSSRVIVSQPTYVKGFAELSASIPLDDWKAYLRVALLNRFAQQLPAAFASAAFDFNGTALTGAQQQSDRWRRGIRAVDAYLPWLLGEAYSARYFSPQSKRRVESMVEQMRIALGRSIDAAAWMTDPTKKEAHLKLGAFYARIGYPPAWLRDYSTLTVTSGDLLGNVLRAARFEREYQLRRIGTRVNRDDWSMTPQTVNAQYSSGENAITFPAAILQPPFFRADADDAVNFGAIGAAIGHEMGHGFDDQGRRSDGRGELRDWWTAADAAQYESRVAGIVKQADAYEALPGLHANGRLTLGENIGDLNGLVIALRAYHQTLEGRPAPIIDGLTGDQRFFIAFAQNWARIDRDDALRRQVTSDPHSPGRFRANMAPRQVPEFYDAFGVKPGDRMFVPPERRVKIW